MIVYQFFPNNGGGSVSWHGTLVQAQAAGKSRPDLMLDSLIRQHDIDTSKEGILLLLNSARNFRNAQREWKFTKRGGIVETRTADRPDVKTLQAPAATGASDTLEDDGPVVDAPALNPEKQAQVAKEMAEWRAQHPFRGTAAAKSKEKS